MTTYIKSTHRKVWKVVETKIEVANAEAPTAAEEVLLQNNDIDLSAIQDGLDERTFEQIKNIEMAHEAWRKLKESFEDSQAMKGAKAYILKEKFASFKMKEDESVSEMFYWLQVLVNDLKALGEEVKDKDFSHKFLICLPSRFSILVTILVSGLDTMTPNQVLRDVMTNDTYRDDDEKEEKKENKDEKKGLAFKATSSKGKAMQDTSSEDEGSFSWDGNDDKKMALFVKRFGKFKVKNGYRARRKKSSSKNKEESRRCFKCESKDHLVTQCPYNSDNDDDDKNSKKEKKEKKDKMTFKKKKGGSYVITWDSDASSSDDDDSDNDKTTKKKALASIVINEKPSLFDTPSTYFMAKATKE
jgi:hypothetical protein